MPADPFSRHAYMSQTTVEAPVIAGWTPVRPDQPPAPPPHDGWVTPPYISLAMSILLYNVHIL